MHHTRKTLHHRSYRSNRSSRSSQASSSVSDTIKPWKQQPGKPRPRKKGFQQLRRANQYTDRSGYLDNNPGSIAKYIFNNDTAQTDMPKMIRSFLKLNGIDDYKIYLFGSSIYGQLSQCPDISTNVSDLDYGVQLPTKYDCYLIKLKFKEWMFRHCHVYTSRKENTRHPCYIPPDYTMECCFIKIFTYNPTIPINIDVGFVHSIEYNLGSPVYAHEALTHDLDSGETFSRISFLDTNLVLQYLHRGETFQLITDNYYFLKRRMLKCVLKGFTIVDAPDIFPECSICYNSIKLNKCCKLGCSHIYHMNCIDKWFGKQRSNQQPLSCPMCRSYLNSQNPTKYYVHCGYG